MDTSFSADEHYRLGLEALERSEYAEALVHFRAADTLDPTRPSFRSHHGLCLGIVERDEDVIGADPIALIDQDLCNNAAFQMLYGLAACLDNDC